MRRLSAKGLFSCAGRKIRSDTVMWLQGIKLGLVEESCGRFWLFQSEFPCHQVCKQKSADLRKRINAPSIGWWVSSKVPVNSLRSKARDTKYDHEVK